MAENQVSAIMKQRAEALEIELLIEKQKIIDLQTKYDELDLKVKKNEDDIKLKKNK